MKRGTRVFVLVNGEEIAARYLNPVGMNHMVQLFGEHHKSTTDQGIREVRGNDVAMDKAYNDALVLAKRTP